MREGNIFTGVSQSFYPYESMPGPSFILGVGINSHMSPVGITWVSWWRGYPKRVSQGVSPWHGTRGGGYPLLAPSETRMHSSRMCTDCGNSHLGGVSAYLWWRGVSAYMWGCLLTCDGGCLLTCDWGWCLLTCGGEVSAYLWWGVSAYLWWGCLGRHPLGRHLPLYHTSPLYHTPPSIPPLYTTPVPPLPPWTEWMTHACENSTFPHTSYANGNNLPHCRFLNFTVCFS